MLAGQLALTVAAVFPGAAIYLNIAERIGRSGNFFPSWRPSFNAAASGSRQRSPGRG